MRSIIGKSVQGRELILHANFPFAPGRRDDPDQSASGTLLIGGTHGDERATVTILDDFIATHIDSGRMAEPLAVLSLHNPDGHAADTRYNGRGVDLNRNFPHQWRPDSEEPSGPHPLSEPESLALHALILAQRPAKIVSLHWALAELDADGPQSAALAEAMWRALSEGERRPYRLRARKHGPENPAGAYCPGSLGRWCGHGLVYPDGSRPAMVTLELPYHAGVSLRPDSLPEDHLHAVREIWRDDPRAYLAGVEGPAHRMLEAACRWESAVAGGGGLPG